MSQEPDSNSEAKLIHRLDEALVNKIAAGEVVLRPANALKEMIENSLDAGATSISILVKEGGIKMLQIQDNGSGIKKGDFPLLCERFATSKIAKFDDLKHLNTYGFRGEALSSISRVARMTVTSMTRDAPFAYKAHFQDGVLVPAKSGEPAEPKACAGVQGTTILIEEMFYNTPARKKALRNPNDEYKAILDLVSKYAIRNHKVSFTLKKAADSSADLSLPASLSPLDPIRVIYGGETSRELRLVTASSKALSFELSGFISGAHQCRKAAFILFINGRLVESNSLKKSVESAYVSYLPKGAKPFCFISLQIKPEHVDVNVSPTKSEVFFLHENEILLEVQSAVASKLAEVNSEKTFNSSESVADKFHEQNPNLRRVLTTSSKSSSLSSLDNDGTESKKNNSVSKHSLCSKGSPAAPPQSLVRNDSRVATLDAYVSTISSTRKRTSVVGPSSSELLLSSQSASSFESQSQLSENGDGSGAVEDESQSSSQTGVVKTLRALKRRRSNPSNGAIPTRLTSVINFLARLDSECDRDLERGLEQHTYVGRLSENHFLLQFNTKLCLVDLKTMVHEMCFQSCFSNFANFTAKITLSPPCPIRDVLGAYLRSRGDTDELSRFDDTLNELMQTLLSWRELLFEYFSICISEDGLLVSLPQLVDQYLPDLRLVPKFLYELAAKVDWSGEEACLFSVALILADFYTYTSQHSLEDIQHHLLPALRTELKPPKTFVTSGTIDAITSMEQLYKVFERC